jgi:ATP-dependent RNA helicase DDX10/DBP4
MPNKEIFSVQDESTLKEYAASLGLASMPKLNFLHKSSDRQELRLKKNVNYKLHKLKEQIKAERLTKKIEKLGEKASATLTNRKRERGVEDYDDLLVVKKRHAVADIDEVGGLPAVDLHQATKSRKKKKKIAVDGSNIENKRIVFDDDGRETNVESLLDATASAKAITGKELEAAHEDYMRKVRERLQSTMAEDRATEKERIREKHRKKRLKERADRLGTDEGGEEMIVTLGSSGDESEHQSGESTSYDEDRFADVRAQEEMALAMIRGSS